MIDIDAQVRGPVFDGRASKAVDDFIKDAENTVADEGVNRVRARLGQVLKNPTGYYESRITTDRQRDDRVVHDQNVVYGPWLEGVGSRNQTTRFKGYRTFRLVAQKLQADAPQIAERVLPKYVGRMNS